MAFSAWVPSWTAPYDPSWSQTWVPTITSDIDD